MPTFSDFMNSLLGHETQQPPKGAGVSATVSLHPDNATEPPKTVNSKVLYILYNPVVDATSGVKLSDYMKWGQPDDMINDFIGEILTLSNGLVRYQIAQRIELNEIPVLADGFKYTVQGLLDVLTNKAPMHNPAGVDYNAIINRFNILQSVANGDIDEVWLMGFPYAGFYESIMGGAESFWCNAPALTTTSSCNRRFVIMGFSYERQVGEMLHSYAHRCESIMAQVYNCQDFLAWAYRPNRSPATITPGQKLNFFQRYILFDQIAPGQAAVGTVHYAPNSTQDYQYGNQASVKSECYDWTNFPNFKGDVRSVSTSEWGGGDDGAFQRWWLGHMPKIAGRINGIHNNWWQYVSDPNNVGS